MRSTIFAVFAFVATILALPQADWSAWPKDQGHGNGTAPFGMGRIHGKCLNDTDVQTLIEGYTYLLEQPTGPQFNTTANSILSDKFAVWSDSIQSLGNQPLGTPAFSSLQVFIARQAQTPPLPNVQTLSSFHSCDQIAWRWNATGIQGKTGPVANPAPVLGMITFSVNTTSKKIDTVYSEFNTAAFLHDLGNPECQVIPAAPAASTAPAAN